MGKYVYKYKTQIKCRNLACSWMEIVNITSNYPQINFCYQCVSIKSWFLSYRWWQKHRLLNNFQKILFIYFWLCWIFVATWTFSLVRWARATLSLLCAGFSLQGLSGCGAQALVCAAHGLSCCSSRAVSSCGTWA